MNTDEAHSSVRVLPLICSEERRFLDGQLSAGDYIEAGQREGESRVRTHASQRRMREIKFAITGFASVAVSVYALMSLTFALSRRDSAALAAMSVAATIIVLTTTLHLIAAIRRRRGLRRPPSRGLIDPTARMRT